MLATTVPPRRSALRRAGARLMSLVLVVATLSAILAVGGAAVLRLTGRQVAVVLSGSMTPQFVAGDAVVVKPAPKPADLKVGEIVTFHAPGTAHLTTHRIVQLVPRPEGLFIQTKGDANAAPDPNFTPASNVVGLAGTVIPRAGRFVILYTNPTFRLFTLGIPLLLLLGYHLGIAVQELRPRRSVADSAEDLADVVTLEAAEPADEDHADDQGTPHDEDHAADHDEDRDDDAGSGPGGPERTTRPLADRPPRQARPVRQRPAHRPVAQPGRIMRRAATAALSVVGAVGITLGATGALYSASAATRTSYTATTSMCASSPYERAVAKDAPDLYWPQGSAAANPTATYSGTVRMPVDGAMYCSDATTFDGGALAQSSATTAGGSYTVETWFRSSSTQAAQIVGFGNVRTGTSTSRERVVYLTSDGRVAVWLNYTSGGSSYALASPASVVDGSWHYIVVTFQAYAATIYVDGKAVSSTTLARSPGTDTGYWRAGTDKVSGLPGVTTAGSLTATLDDTAIYSRVLTSAQISAHWGAAGS